MTSLKLYVIWAVIGFCILGLNCFGQLSVTGNVTDELSKNTIPGIKISLLGKDGSAYSTLTDGGGNYSFKIDDPKLTEYIVSIADSNYCKIRGLVNTCPKEKLDLIDRKS